jgi:hypothetical protein
MAARRVPAPPRNPARKAAGPAVAGSVAGGRGVRAAAQALPPVLSPRSSASGIGSLTDRGAPQVKVARRGREHSGRTRSATARSASDKTRYSQTLQPGSEEYYTFYLNRRKGKKQAQHESAGYGWTDTEENSVVQPWLHDKARRRKNAQGVQRRQKDADKQLLLDLQHKARARDREEAKGLMMDLHRWIAGITARIEKRATSSFLSDISKKALRRDQLQLRSNIARLLQFTNVMAKGTTVNRNLLDQLRKFHGEVNQQKKVAASSQRGRREGLPPQARLSELGTAGAASSIMSSGSASRSSGLVDDSQSLMDWRPVYEMDGISVGIRTYRSPKGKLVEDNTGTEVELLWKVRVSMRTTESWSCCRLDRTYSLQYVLYFVRVCVCACVCVCVFVPICSGTRPVLERIPVKQKVLSYVDG